MNPETWQRIKPILEEAMALAPEERIPFLDRRAESESEATRHHIDQILELNDGAGSFLEPPSFIDPILPTPLAPGHQIAAYRILEPIGQGGMANVYLAVRADNQFKQRVAIKVARPGLESERRQERFEEERRILAALDHDYIARLYDGGSLADGSPYFIMEYVEGLPIDQFCDQHRYTIDQRLRLFQRVCEAVQAAHRSLIVHRDLKPANILIRADGIPKLLDFGIAKLISEELPNRAALTQTGQRPLTPQYASPEQIRGEITTTATDIYALGVLLYRLLAGSWPYEIERWDLVEVARSICEDEPILPSARVLQLASRPIENSCAETFAEKFQAGSLGRLARRLDGDLDQIVARTLRKDPQHRYHSVEKLSEDIGRELSCLPVQARKGNRLYRAKKFTKRHYPVLVSTTILVLLLLAVGIQTMRIAHQRQSDQSLATGRLLAIVEQANPASDFFYHQFLYREIRKAPPQSRLHFIDEALSSRTLSSISPSTLANVTQATVGTDRRLRKELLAILRRRLADPQKPSTELYAAGRIALELSARRAEFNLDNPASSLCIFLMTEQRRESQQDSWRRYTAQLSAKEAHAYLEGLENFDPETCRAVSLEESEAPSHLALWKTGTSTALSAVASQLSAPERASLHESLLLRHRHRASPVEEELFLELLRAIGDGHNTEERWQHLVSLPLEPDSIEEDLSEAVLFNFISELPQSEPRQIAERLLQVERLTLEVDPTADLPYWLPLTAEDTLENLIDQVSNLDVRSGRQSLEMLLQERHSRAPTLLSSVLALAQSIGQQLPRSKTQDLADQLSAELLTLSPLRFRNNSVLLPSLTDSLPVGLTERILEKLRHSIDQRPLRQKEAEYLGEAVRALGPLFRQPSLDTLEGLLAAAVADGSRRDPDLINAIAEVLSLHHPAATMAQVNRAQALFLAQLRASATSKEIERIANCMVALPGELPSSVRRSALEHILDLIEEDDLNIFGGPLDGQIALASNLSPADASQVFSRMLTLAESIRTLAGGWLWMFWSPVGKSIPADEAMKLKHSIASSSERLDANSAVLLVYAYLALEHAKDEELDRRYGLSTLKRLRSADRLTHDRDNIPFRLLPLLAPTTLNASDAEEVLPLLHGIAVNHWLRQGDVSAKKHLEKILSHLDSAAASEYLDLLLGATQHHSRTDRPYLSNSLLEVVVQRMSQPQKQTVTSRIMVAARERGTLSPNPNVLMEALSWSPGWPAPEIVLEFLDAYSTVGDLRATTIRRLETEAGEEFNGDLWRAVDWLNKNRRQNRS